MTGPTHVVYYPSGELYSRQWTSSNLVSSHRIDGPAYVSRYRNGKLKRQEWWIRGKSHRVIFPSSIDYDSKGKIVEFAYFNYNQDITDKVTQYLEENGLNDPLSIPFDHQIIMKLKFW